jgi:hypothetical protein
MNMLHVITELIIGKVFLHAIIHTGHMHMYIHMGTQNAPSYCNKF